MSLEIEVKYLVLKTVLDRYLDLNSNPSVLIEQFYFSPSEIERLLLPVLRESALYDLKSFPKNCQNGRVRFTKSDATSEYSLTVKAPRENLFARMEYEIEISEQQFFELQKKSDYGNIKKRRTQINGHILLAHENKPIVAEVDDYLAIAGVPVALSKDLSFLVVEVEAENEGDLKSIRAGSHDFNFLEQAIELMSLPQDLQPYFKNTYLARAGLDYEKVKSVCEQLPK